MIIVQKNITRDIIGIANALSSIGRPIHLWDPAQDDIGDINDITTVIMNNVSSVGYKTFSDIPKLANIILININEKPKALEKKNNCFLVKLPLCADDVLYPEGFFIRQYECDLSYISNFTLEGRPYVQGLLGFIPTRKYKMRIVGGVPLNVVPYMGPIERHNIIKLCKSSRLCIDFDFNIAIDLIYHGCPVISNIENEFIPYFNESNILEVIEREIAKPQPIINELREKTGIMTYKEFLPNILGYIQ